MNTDEKKLTQAIAEAVSVLPREKREFMMGYAEGVLAMRNLTQFGRVQPAVRGSA